MTPRDRIISRLSAEELLIWFELFGYWPRMTQEMRERVTEIMEAHRCEQIPTIRASKGHKQSAA